MHKPPVLDMPQHRANPTNWKQQQTWKDSASNSLQIHVFPVNFGKVKSYQIKYSGNGARLEILVVGQRGGVFGPAQLRKSIDKWYSKIMEEGVKPSVLALRING